LGACFFAAPRFALVLLAGLVASAAVLAVAAAAGGLVCSDDALCLRMLIANGKLSSDDSESLMWQEQQCYCARLCCAAQPVLLCLVVASALELSIALMCLPTVRDPSISILQALRGCTTCLAAGSKAAAGSQSDPPQSSIVPNRY
jgi:hypothetical protein